MVHGIVICQKRPNAGPLGISKFAKESNCNLKLKETVGCCFTAASSALNAEFPFRGLRSGRGWAQAPLGRSTRLDSGLDLSLSYAYALITSALIGSYFTPLGNWKCINGPANAAMSPASTRWRESPYWVSSDGLISFRRYKQGRTQVGLNSKFFTRQEHGSLFPARFTYFSPSFLCAIVKKKMFLLNDN